MTAFTDLRDQLAAARMQRDAAAAALARQREVLKNLQRRIADVQRTVDGDAARARLASLTAQARELSEALDAQRGALGALKTSATQLAGELAALADPSTQIEALDDGVPILLFPVRVEVRFHQGVQASGASGSQLWVRIYPDDCQIDGFEALLTDSELSNATAFWVATWRAGGVLAQERGAWRSLTASSGSGRAAYVISQFAPVNPADRPTKAQPQDVVLVIVPQLEVTPTEQAAAVTYWTAVWHADGADAPVQAAYAALQGAVGAARAAALVAGFAPDPIGWDPPAPSTRADVALTIAVLHLPPPPTTRQASWTQAPKAVALPDRFVVIASNAGVVAQRVVGRPIPDALATSPDPSLPVGEQIGVTDDDLALDANLAWVADFDRAVEVGMGVRIDLTPAQALTGFDRLLVLGVRASADAAAGQQQLQTLIAHQLASKAGYGLVPQGSPTNNTDDSGTGYSWVDDPDASFDTVFGGTNAYLDSDDPLAMRDGQWLAATLGIDGALVRQLSGAAGNDQREARAMNIALWNGTAGYMLEEMLKPVVSRADIARTRLFFTRHVSGRGPLPAVRVGKQPYGLLPATAYSRWQAFKTDRPRLSDGSLAPDYLQRLSELLRRIDADWQSLVPQATHIGQAGDPHQALLDVVGLHSGAVEYHQRYAESLAQVYNKVAMEAGELVAMVVALALSQAGQALLNELGADPTLDPPILEKFFYGQSALLSGPVVDDVPLSEQAPVRPITPDRKNYLQWLATSSLDTIRIQDFGGVTAPTALLYLLLRHAMMLGQWDAGLRFLESRALADPEATRVEASFIHVQSSAQAVESKFAPLYAPQPAVTGSPTLPLAAYVLRPDVLATAPENEDLREIVAALGVLADTPTARLERALAEHVDCCTYRLDAWKTGLVAERLQQMRGSPTQPRPGIHLGAFGWLEDVRPKAAADAPVRLDPDQAAVFQRPGDAPLVHDAANAGFIHAPSLNHAATAAILKNAYRVNATPAQPDVMAVNLSSVRVREALALLEGLRNGQTLAALLGYVFERGLHDTWEVAEADAFIYPLRQIFPLAANQLKSTATDSTVDITLVEARNVIDGVALVARARDTATYPFGIPTGTAKGQVPVATPAQEAAINATVQHLLDLNDALGDLVTAESVYQTVLGNFDRAAAVASAFSQGAHPPEMQVVDTPRSGLQLTHRVALHFDASVDPATSPNALPTTPRSRAEAPLNHWLAGRLPAPDRVGVAVKLTSPALPGGLHVTVTQADLGLQPIDALLLFDPDIDQAMTELDDRIVQAMRYGAHAHPDLAVAIAYTEPVAGLVSFFELAALVGSLRVIVLKSRALGPTDLALPLESVSADDTVDDAELATRISGLAGELQTLRDGLAAYAGSADGIDDYAKGLSQRFLQLALFGIPQTGTGQIHGDIRAAYGAIAAPVAALVVRWKQRATDYAALMAGYAALTTDAARIALLRQAEGLVLARTTPQPPAPAAYRAAVDAAHAQFAAALAQAKALGTWNGDKVADFAAAVEAFVPVAAFHDATALDVAAPLAALPTQRATLVSRANAVVADATQRLSDVAAVLAASHSAPGSPERARALVEISHRILGEDMPMMPRFALSSGHAAEFANAVAGSAGLLTDLRAAGRRFPVDDWLYGLARVRSKLAAWEQVVVLGEAFGAASAELSPLQLPYLANDRWAALEFDVGTAPTSNRLLYTAHLAAPFAAGQTQCGVLIDDWPEVVPAKDVVSGLTFHFDRPSSQPPQAMLLAVPPVVRGHWVWDDLQATLDETLDAAKARAVEPTQLDATKYAQMLPATLMAVTLYQITIATNLGLNNRIYDSIKAP